MADNEILPIHTSPDGTSEIETHGADEETTGARFSLARLFTAWFLKLACFRFRREVKGENEALLQPQQQQATARWFFQRRSGGEREAAEDQASLQPQQQQATSRWFFPGFLSRSGGERQANVVEGEANGGDPRAPSAPSHLILRRSGEADGGDPPAPAEPDEDNKNSWNQFVLQFYDLFFRMVSVVLLFVPAKYLIDGGGKTEDEPGQTLSAITFPDYFLVSTMIVGVCYLAVHCFTDKRFKRFLEGVAVFAGCAAIGEAVLVIGEPASLGVSATIVVFLLILGLMKLCERCNFFGAF